MFNRFPEEFRLLAVIFAILAITATTAWIVNRMLGRALPSNGRALGVDETRMRFLRRLAGAGIYLVGISAALTRVPELKILGHSLLAGAGLLTLIGGLASQQLLSNLVGGFLIVFFRPFKINDRVTVNTFTGVVEDITLRETVLRDFENNRVIVPNSLIGNQVLVNSQHTDERVCKFIDVGVGYGSDIDNALRIVVDEIVNHRLHIDPRSPLQKEAGDPVAVARVTGLGNSSVMLRGWAWAATPTDGFVLQCDLLHSIKQRFDREGIEIPFPQTTVSFASGSQHMGVE